jgi:flavin-dependent dehydrogenase
MAETPASPRKAKIRVAVIGGGVIGLSCAWELARRGADVAVYERGTALGAGATIRSAGMLAAAFEWAAEEQRPLAALARHAGQMWPDFAARLERDGGGPVEYSSEGAIVVARNAAEFRLRCCCPTTGRLSPRWYCSGLPQRWRAPASPSGSGRGCRTWR